MAFQKITESESLYDNLDQMSVRELLEGINNEDRKVAIAVGREIPKIEKLVTRIVERMRRGGRLFYIGAGTSGRLGVLDASEIPPTYGMPNTLVIGLIAGGDRALRNPVESAEDDLDKAWEELQQYHINTNDTLVGIAASGTTPYVIGALRKARSEGNPDGLYLLQPGLSDGGGGGDRHRAGSRSGVRHRKYADEERYGPEDGAEYDHDLHDDQAWPGEGEPDGEHATDQPKIGGPWHPYDHGRASSGLRAEQEPPAPTWLRPGGDRFLSP